MDLIRCRFAIPGGRALLRRKPFVYAHLRAAESDHASNLPRRCAP
jgi:hypothetical protein